MTWDFPPFENGYLEGLSTYNLDCVDLNTNYINCSQKLDGHYVLIY